MSNAYANFISASMLNCNRVALVTYDDQSYFIGIYSFNTDVPLLYQEIVDTSVTALHHSSYDNYIFVFASNSTGLYLDSYFYLEFPTPSEPLAPIDPPLPSQPLALTPVTILPTDPPQQSVPIYTYQPASVPPTVDVVAVAVGVSVPTAAVAFGVFLLIFFLRKKKGHDSTSVKNPAKDLDEEHRSEIELPEIDKRLQIPYKDLIFNNEIGAGSYGKVYAG